MKICFIDEAGDLGALANPPLPNDQPVLVISGLFVDAASLHGLTDDFLNLKQRYFPNLPYPSAKPLDRILPEIKGADVRRNATRGTARQRQHAIGFLDQLLRLLRRYDVKLVARIWVKGIGLPFDATPVYTSSIQAIFTYFDHHLTRTGDAGICIADSRNKFKNVNVSHSIFTQKFNPAAQGYRRIVELPTFGHSDNHAGLQVCDIVCSALLYPIACLRLLRGSREQRPCATRRREAQAALRAAAEGYPIPIPGRSDWPSPWWACGFRRHPAPERLVDVSLKQDRRASPHQPGAGPSRTHVGTTSGVPTLPPPDGNDRLGVVTAGLDGLGEVVRHLQGLPDRSSGTRAGHTFCYRHRHFRFRGLAAGALPGVPSRPTRGADSRAGRRAAEAAGDRPPAPVSVPGSG